MLEDALVGTGAAWDGDGGSAFDDVFVAQWGRDCFAPPAAAREGDGATRGGGNDAATPTACYVIETDRLPPNSPFYFFARHYLDPQVEMMWRVRIVSLCH